MMDFFMNYLDFVIGGVIAGLFFMLGFFMSTVRSEKRHYKLRERQMREEIAAAKKTGGRSSEDAAELGRLRAEVTAQLEAIKQKDCEIESLIDQLGRATADHRKLEGQIGEAGGGKGEIELLRAELDAKTGEIAAKEQQFSRFQEEHRDMDEKIGKAEATLAAYGKFEKDVQAQKDRYQEIEQRLAEIKIKMRVLTEKAKEGVELIAAFAAGKEFGDFRDAVHQDEAKQKDEDRTGAEPAGPGQV